MKSPDPDRESRAAAIAHLNDRLRLEFQAGWTITRGVRAKGATFLREAILAVNAFTDFEAGGDPNGERAFGAFNLLGEKVLWKIDYYDRSLRAGSPNPADPSVTRRVLTLMLAEDQ